MFLCISYHADWKGENIGKNSLVCYKTICQETGIKNEKTISEKVHHLKDLGLLKFEKIPKGGGQYSHRYEVFFPMDI